MEWVTNSDRITTVRLLLHCPIYNRGSRQAVRLPVKHMLRVKLPVHGVMPYRQTSKPPQGADARQYPKDNPKRLRVGAHNDLTRRRRDGHSSKRGHEGVCILRNLQCAFN